MAQSGSETRQRSERYTVRFTPLEGALICARAKAAGVPIATYSGARPFLSPSRAQRDAEETGESHGAIQSVAEAILRLGRLMNPLDAPSNRRRCHLQLLE